MQTVDATRGAGQSPAVAQRRTYAFQIGVLAAVAALAWIALYAAELPGGLTFHLALSLLWGLGVGLAVSGWFRVARAIRAEEPAGFRAMTLVTFATCLVPWLPLGLVFHPLLVVFAIGFVGVGGTAGILAAALTGEPWTTGLAGLVVGSGLYVTVAGLILLLAWLLSGFPT